MLNTDNLRHSLAVARYMYSHAGDIYDNPTEEERRDLWLLGFLHDIGREFSEKDGKYHGLVGADMLYRAGFKNFYEVGRHGIEFDSTRELKLLNEADWHIDSRGRKTSLKERLKNVEKNHGKHSKAYQCAEKMYETLKESEKADCRHTEGGSHVSGEKTRRTNRRLRHRQNHRGH